jgi:uncharacterized protein YggU (UPF0235/DUF167 family)
MSEPPGTAIRPDGTGWLVNVKARPGARANRIRGEEAGLLLVDIAAVAEDGKATEQLLVYLATCFGVRRRDVTLLAGAHARWKRIRIEGGTPPAA